MTQIELNSLEMEDAALLRELGVPQENCMLYRLVLWSSDRQFKVSDELIDQLIQSPRLLHIAMNLEQDLGREAAGLLVASGIFETFRTQTPFLESADPLDILA